MKPITKVPKKFESTTVPGTDRTLRDFVQPLNLTYQEIDGAERRETYTLADVGKIVIHYHAGGLTTVHFSPPNNSTSVVTSWVRKSRRRNRD